MDDSTFNSTSMFWIGSSAPSYLKGTIDYDHYLRHVVGIRFVRVQPIVHQQLIIPSDVASTWESKHCLSDSSLIKRTGDQVTLPKGTSVTSDRQSPSPLLMVSGLCGRGKGRNNLTDLEVTVSHLFAIWKAIHQNITSSRYAIIAEKDVVAPFDIDYSLLGRSAPKGFGIIKFFNSHEFWMEKYFGRYIRNNSELWTSSHSDKFYDAWASKAYLIDREVLRPVLGRIGRLLQGHQRNIFDFKILAGLHNPCVPSACCSNVEVITNTTKHTYQMFNDTPPCIDSRYGFQVERYLFKLVPTYILNIPLFTSELSAGADTNQVSALKRQKLYMNDLITGQTPLPPFVQVGCNKLVL